MTAACHPAAPARLLSPRFMTHSFLSPRTSRPLLLTKCREARGRRFPPGPAVCSPGTKREQEGVRGRRVGEEEGPAGASPPAPFLVDVLLSVFFPPFFRLPAVSTAPTAPATRSAASGWAAGPTLDKAPNCATPGLAGHGRRCIFPPPNQSHPWIPETQCIPRWKPAEGMDPAN